MKIADVIEIAELRLEAGDVLYVKVISDDVTMEDVENLKDRLQTLFPDNKIMMVVLPANSDVELQVIKQEKMGEE